MKNKAAGGMYGATDAEVFGLAVHYYDEADIKVKKNVSAKVVINRELTEEEKEFLADKRQYAVDKIIYEYMHFTDEDMQRFLDEGEVYEESNVLKYEECKKIAKKYKKNFG